MLVLRQSWEWSSSTCPKIGRLFCFLQPWQTTYKHCISFLQTGLIFMRHMRGSRQLTLSNSSMFSFIKMWRMFISCTSCHRWRIWVFVLQSCLLPDAGIVVISITGVILISISFLIKDNIQGLSCEESFRFIHMHPKAFSMIRVSKEEVGGKRTPVCPLKTLPCSHLHGCIINLSGLEKIN